MQDKVCLVTGATSGIGKETALGLAKLGASVIVVGRNRSKGEAVVAEIKAQSGNPKVKLLVADLSVQAQVRKLAEEVRDKYDRLDVLVNNAGGIYHERQLTSDGIEYTLALNHLNYFLLTNLLLDLLKASAPARIINVASGAHQMGKIDFDNLQGEKRYRGFGAYAASKLENILFTYELARRLQGSGVTVNCLHPGGVESGFWDSARGMLRIALKVVRLFLISAAQGAETPLYLATSPAVETVTGGYFDKKKAVRSSAASYDEDLAKRLWEISAKMTGITK